MIDFKTLQHIDIKSIIQKLNSIDVRQVKDVVFQRKDIFINIAIIGITVIASRHLLRYQNLSLSNLKEKIQTLEEKVTMIELYENKKHKHDDFFHSIPDGFSSFMEIIDKVSIFAETSGVTILSFDPGKPSQNEFFSKISVEFLVSSATYGNILRFIEKIENQAEGLRIDSLMIQENRRGRDLGISDGTNLQYKFQISSLSLKTQRSVIDHVIP